MPTERSAVILSVAILALAFLFRVAGVERISSYSGDQAVVVPGMHAYLSSGNFEPDGWEHPPLKYYLLRGSIFLFGNNVYGWRMKNVLFGTATILILFLLGRELFPDARIALTAMMMLAIDPLHIFFSRTIHAETTSVPFLLLAAYFTIRYAKHKSASPLLAGLCLGLALAQKWYFLPSVLTLWLYVIIVRTREHGFRFPDVLHLSVVYWLLPLCVYLLPFYHWFKRGYDITEFFKMQLSAFRSLQDLPLEYFTHDKFLAMGAAPWTWFLKPIIAAARIPGGPAGWGRFFVFMNDPPLWLLTLPALAFFLYRARKTGTSAWLLIALLFCATYFQFAFADRPIFLYSAIVVLPFAFLMVAYLLVALADAAGPVWPFRALLAVMFLWGIYLYPFALGKPVPLALYAPLLSLGGIASP